MKLLKKVNSFAVSLALLLQMSGIATMITSSVAHAADTGPFLAPTSTHLPNDWDVNTVANVQTSNNTYASEGGGQEQGYSNFSLPAIAANATIDGISVEAEANSTDSSGCNLDVMLSWNNGTSYTSAQTMNLTNSDSTSTLGGATNTWGRTWAASDFTNANFVVKVQDNDPGNNCTNSATTSLDLLRVKINYTIPVLADLTITKSNNVNGSVEIGQNFNWVLTVNNIGNASATFNARTILTDTMPSGVSYGTPVVSQGVDVTGTVVCSISSNDLTCSDANGGSSVVLGAGSAFTVTIPVTADAAGSYTNPRSGNATMCRVDPDSRVTESNESNNDCVGNTVAVTNIASLPNPALGSSCGLDVALVLDNSGSISTTELNSMKSAMTAFTAAFSGTPTQFSVTKFADTGTVVQAFTSDITAVNTAINAIPQNGGATNWEDGLVKAKSTFDPRVSKPNMVIFASDGNPNRVDNGTTVSESTAVNQAIVVANSLKSTYSAHILALGIGADLNTANMEAISGAGDVITSDFSTLAVDLASLAATLCGGTITTTKLIDADGNPATTNDQTPAANWEFDVNGAPTNPAPVVTDENGQTPSVEVDPGTYSVNETTKNGYKVIGASCSKNQQTLGSWQSNSSSVTGIVVGETDIVHCTFINTYNQGTLIVNKVVTNNNGGTAIASSFGFKVNNGPEANFNVNGSNSLTVTAGTYTVTEGAHVGYDATYDNCTNVTVPAGGTVTCTITNDDIAPQLTVIKHVNNTHGGTAKASDFDMQVTGVSNFYSHFPGDENGTTISIPAGAYNVAESGPGFYGASLSNDCGGTIALGQTKTCTITNSDLPTTVTITKVVKNNFGGTLSTVDFPLYLDNMLILSGVPTTDFKAATYQVKEPTDIKGYHLTGLSGDCYVNNEDSLIYINLSIGVASGCTLTNSDIQPKLKVIKLVDNAFGGTAKSRDFIMNVSGTNVSNTGFDGDENGTDITLNVGTYSVTEGNHDGYDVSYSPDCTGTASVGDDKTCTVTNTEIQPTLTLVKKVQNTHGGTAEESDFALTIDDTTTSSGEVVSLQSNVAYEINELGKKGYEFVSLSGEGCPTELGGTVTLASGKDLTCTITNRDIAPTLTLHKEVSGGLSTPSDWMLTATPEENGVKAIEISGNGDDGVEAVPAKANVAYTLSEDSDITGYTAGEWGCNGGTIEGNVLTMQLGENVECTITNTEIKPTIKLVKVVQNYNGGSAEASDFTLNIGDESVKSGSTTTVNSGEEYSIDEGYMQGYEFVSITGDKGCPRELGDTVVLSSGETLTCTITNRDIAPRVTVFKQVAGNSSNLFDFTVSQEEQDDQTFKVSGDYNDSDYSNYHTITAKAGELTITENVDPLHWSTNIVCSTNNDDGGYVFFDNTQTATLDLNVGENYYCTYYNLEASTINITKYEDKNKNGTWDEGEKALSGWDMHAMLTDTNSESDSDPTTLNGTTNSDGTVSFSVLDEFQNADEYTLAVSETQKAGWTLTNITCDITDPTMPQIETVDRQILSITLDENTPDTTIQAGSVANCYVGNFKKPITAVLSDTITPPAKQLSNTGAHTTIPMIVSGLILFITLAMGALKRKEQ